MSGGRQKVLLLLILVGAGGWNYYRNAELENAELRPYRGYSETALEQLIAAYQTEVEHRSGRYQAVAARDVSVRDRALLGDRVDEFERIQRISQQRREVGGQLTDNMVSLEGLQIEQQKRQADRPVYQPTLRRLFSF
jgi:hypothetical protein